MRAFVIGTRGSRLALRQTAIVRDALVAAHHTIQIDVLQIRTEGDASSAPLSEIGGQGIFTKAIEDALLAGHIDVAVHSLKDLPPGETPGLTIAAIPPRGDPRDALVVRQGARLADLPPGARIGTGSARRAVQLRRMRPDVEPVDIRGNVDTRVRKVESGEYDAAVLALAGLQRLGLESKIAQVFTVDEMIPAVGQACLAVQVRSDDGDAIEAVQAVDDPSSRASADCERAFLAQLGAGCRLPVGAYARMNGAALEIQAFLSTDGGEQQFTFEGRGTTSDAPALGALAASDLARQAGIDLAKTRV